MKATHIFRLVVAVAPSVLFGQTGAADNFNPISTGQQGVHLYGVSVYSGYYSSGPPVGVDTSVQTSFLGSTVIAGAAATFGGSKSDDNSMFSWNYSPSYINSINNGSSHGSVSHRMSVNWSRKLGGKWSVSASVSGLLANLEQLYFSPGVLGSAASLPSSFDDLAAGMLTGKFTDAQLASLLTGAPVQGTPEQGFLYGNRIFSGAANVTIGWSPSGRTTLSATLTGTRSQNWSSSGTGNMSNSAAGIVVPQTTAASAGLSWSYSLSPRTQISASASSSRMFSRLQQDYATNASFSIGRIMSRRWFAQVTGGAGTIFYLQQLYPAPTHVQYLYGGSLGFKTTSQTFLVSYNRSLGDSYGLGSNTTSGASGAWTWRRPGSAWSTSASGGYQELNNPTFRNTRSWRAGAGLARSLSQHFFVSAQYIYFQIPADLKMAGVDNSQHGVMVSMTWSPSQYR